MPKFPDAIVVGGGFYGLRIALFLREELGLKHVLVLEANSEPLSRASINNQARVHNGYHYPRSLLTGYRSRVNFPRFAAEFSDAVTGDFQHYYGIARQLSKTNARQFELYCRRIGAYVRDAPPAAVNLFDRTRLEKLFLVKEPSFDATLIRQILLARVESVGGIELLLGTPVSSVRQGRGYVEVETDGTASRSTRVIGAVYAATNKLHAASGVPLIALQFELAELAIVEMPDALKGSAFTIMDGPFFSIMPFPPRGLHSLSHVRYTVHHRWREPPAMGADVESLARAALDKSRYANMRADVLRFIPSAHAMKYRDSLFEVKTVMSSSSGDDSRPILFQPDHGIQGYTCVMGGKLDNIYDVLTEVGRIYAE